MADELKTSEAVLRIGDIAAAVTQMLADDRAKMDLFARIDQAVACVFEPYEAIKKLPWVQNRHYGMTDISDARNTGVRTFATLMPQIEIAPLNDAQEEYERTDMAEQAWQWEFERMNRIGQKSVHEQIMEDAMSYHAVAFQTEYLPYKLKGRPKDNRTKAMLRSRCFNWVRHHPGTVHARHSDYGLESVAKVHPYSVKTLMENFGADNPGIAKLMEKHRNAKPDELLKTKYVLVDYMDLTNRVQFALPSPSGSVPSVVGDSDIVFMNEAHGLPFIPWVIIDKGDPIWTAVITSGTWDNMQYMNLIRFAKSIEQSTRSTMIIKTPDGKLQNVWMDYSNPSNPIVVPMDGTTVEPFPSPQMDPQLENMFQAMKQDTSSSTVSHVLRDVSRFGDTPFSSVNQMVNLALGQLSRAKNAAGEAEAAGIYQGFQWIEHSGIPFTAYRPKTTDSKVEGEPYNGKGGQIVIKPGAAPTEKQIAKMDDKGLALLARTVYFDLEALYIHVELQSNNATDEQSRLNVVINAKDKLNMSTKEAWEKMGWTGYEINQNQRAIETLADTELQKEVQLILLQVEEAKQKLIMGIQQQAQQQQQQQEQAAMKQQQSQEAALLAQGGGQQPTMQGQDMRAGGNPAMMQAPGMTREQVSGQSAAGEDIQR
jgi:hypothetical protein